MGKANGSVTKSLLKKDHNDEVKLEKTPNFKNKFIAFIEKNAAK